MKNLTDMNSKEFLTVLASSEPVPGGGGAAAVAGALAAALSSMVANLTLGKEKFAGQEEEIRHLLQQAEDTRVKLLQLTEDDAAVFSNFMSCYRLPKNTEEEKAKRAEAICNAAKQAASVPFAIGQAGLTVLAISERLAVIGNPGVITDSTCSALLARAALRCSEYNVRVNLGLTKDADYNKQLTVELEAMLQEAERLENAVIAQTDTVIG